MSDLLQYHASKIAENEGFCDYKIETKDGSEPGLPLINEYMNCDIYLSIYITGTKVQNGKLYQDELHLLCKMPPLNDMQKDFASNTMFRREIYLYMKILPTFVRFQQEKGLSETDSFLSFPKIFICEENEENGNYFIIMEDLRPKNFEMWPKEQTIPIDHELFVMRELGKFHAISFALKDQRPNEFEEFKCLRDPNFENAFRYEVGALISKTTKIIDTTIDLLENPKHKQFLRKFRNTYEDMVADYVVSATSEEFSTVIHGDCIFTAVLFQYSKKNKNEPELISLLDWQACRYGSPVLDVLYNIFSSTDKPFRDQYYEILLKAYHASLSETIEKLGSDPNKLYTYDDFQKQLKKFGHFTLLCVPLLILRVAKSHGETNRADDQDKRDAIFNNFEETKQTYVKLINDLFVDLVNYNYITID